MKFHIVTLFKEAFDSYLHESIMARALAKGFIGVSFYNPRDFTKDKFRRVDDRPYGGGPGMVLQVEPLLNAVSSIVRGKKKTKVLIFSPAGRQFTNAYARELAEKYNHLVLVAGRYEGIDARLKKILKADLSAKALASVEEISIGPYILSGGELPALVVVETVARQVPGVLGKAESIEESRVSSPEVYTRPEIFNHKGKKYRVPKVLLSGNHADIEKWKKNRS